MSNLPSNPIYQEGYSAGNSGLTITYLPFQYRNDPEAMKQWQLGWKKGAKDAGINTNPFLKKILIIIVIIAFTASVFFFMFRQNPDDNQASTAEKNTPTSSQNNNTANTHSDQKIKNAITTNAITTNTISRLPQTIISQPRDSTTDDDTDLLSVNLPQNSVNETSISSSVEITEIADDQQEEKVAETIDTVEATNGYEHISSAVFAKKIINRNPYDVVANTADNISELYFHTKLENAIGKRIKHQWYYADNLINETTFKEIQGLVWRLYSKQKIDPQQLGQWTVKVIDQNDTLLVQKTITVE